MDRFNIKTLCYEDVACRYGEWSPGLRALFRVQKISQPVYADSLEVLVQYYREKLQTLEAVLESLNVLENSREISCLCREVTRTKKHFAKSSKRNNSHTLSSPCCRPWAVPLHLTL